MPINTLFNETELAIFHRQTRFTFSDYHQFADGTIYAVDRKSCQIFIGNDLLRSNVHALDSIVSVNLEDNRIIHLSFKDLSSARINANEEEAVAIVSELESYSGNDTAVPSPEDEETVSEEEIPRFLSNKDLSETYSRLVNTGRSTAIGYLVEEAGISVEEAGEYVKKIDSQEDMVESVPEPYERRDGTMTNTAILEIVKTLEPGDTVHIKYKPFTGKTRFFDAEYRRINVDICAQRYFSENASADNYSSLAEEIMHDFYDYLYLIVFNEESCSETSLRLSRIKMLRKMSGNMEK